MISKKHVKDFVREGEMEKIENYDKAIADTTQIWECHHRLEITLEGEFAHTAEELIRMEMYYNRPYFELIFLTPSEHRRLHGKARSECGRNKISKARKGQKLSEEQRKKMSFAHKGMKFSEEHKERLSKPKSEFGRKYFDHYGYLRDENIRQYTTEHNWYYRHNKKCRWE